MNLAAKAEQRRIHVAKEFIDQGKIALKAFFHGFAGEARGGNGREEMEIVEFVSGDFARAEDGWFAEEITLEKGIAERAGFVELGLRFDFFGEELKAIAFVAADDVGAQVAVGGAEIHFQEFHEREKHLPFGVADVVVERQHVAGGAEILAELDHLWSGSNGFENLDDHAVRRQETRGAALQGGRSRLMKALATPVSIWRSKSMVESTMMLLEASF